MGFKSNFGYTFSRAEVITDTDVHEGRIGALVALGDGKIDDLESPMLEFINTSGSSNKTDIFPLDFKKNTYIEGIITKVQMKSGSAIIYFI